jgi:DNA-3-methyladenine glycosylase
MTTKMTENNLDFLDQPPYIVAPRLLGCYLERIYNGRKLVVKIVETEAYDQTDAASHSYKGQTPRTDVMFGPSGQVYIYFTYGMHYCCNVVTGPAGNGSAVLIRAVEPIEGAKVMQDNRGKQKELTNGPAKLCQALAIDRNMNGHDLKHLPLRLIAKPQIANKEIIQTTRIGISQAKDVAWRFFISANPYVSKPAAL